MEESELDSPFEAEEFSFEAIANLNLSHQWMNW